MDDEVKHILESLSEKDVDSENYGIGVRNLEILCKARSCENKRSVSMDTLVLAATNILGIVLILNYETWHVLPSKALGLILKGRF
jgi:hypothetical protein